MKKLLGILFLIVLISCGPIKEDDSIKRLNAMTPPVTVIAVKPETDTRYSSMLVIDSLKHIESFTQLERVGATYITPQTKVGDVVVK